MSEKIVSQNKIYWLIGLICMITISFNSNVIMPLGLLILLIMSFLKKDYQTIITENLKKVIIAILIGLILGLLGVGPRLSIYGGKTEAGGYKAGFNFSLFQISLPDFLISRTINSVDNIESTNTSSEESPLQKYQNIVESNFTGGFQECQSLVDDFVVARNTKSSSGFKAGIISQSGISEQDQMKIINFSLGIRETYGSMTGLKNTNQQSYIEDNIKYAVITYVGDFDIAINTPIGIECQYNNEKDKRERSSWKAGDNVASMIK